MPPPPGLHAGVQRRERPHYHVPGWRPPARHRPASQRRRPAADPRRSHGRDPGRPLRAGQAVRLHRSARRHRRQRVWSAQPGIGVTDGPGVALTDWRVVMAPNGDHATPPAPDAPGWAAVKVGDDPFHGSKASPGSRRPSRRAAQRGRPPVLHFESVDDIGRCSSTADRSPTTKAGTRRSTSPLDAALADGQPVVMSVLVQNTDGAGGMTGPVTLLSYRSDAPVTGWKMRGGIESGLSADGLEAAPPGRSRRLSPLLPRTLHGRAARRRPARTRSCASSPARCPPASSGSTAITWAATRRKSRSTACTCPNAGSGRARTRSSSLTKTAGARTASLSPSRPPPAAP